MDAGIKSPRNVNTPRYPPPSFPFLLLPMAAVMWSESGVDF